MNVATLDETADVRVGIAQKLNFAPGGRRFTCSFITPGLVSGDNGRPPELLRKETIDRALESFMRQPVTIKHVPAVAKGPDGRTVIVPVPENDRCGLVDAVSYDEASGWYTAGGEMTEEARAEVKMNGGAPSCGYVITKTGPGGTWAGIPYAKEFQEIQFHHLAIVPVPRYEDAEFKLNHKPGSTMFNLIKVIMQKLNGSEKETVTREKTPIDGETIVEVDGVETTLAQLHSKANAKPADVPPAIPGDSEVEVNGQKVKVSVLIASHQKLNANEAEDEAAAAKKKKDDEDAAAAAEADKTAKANAGAAAFRTLQNAPLAPAVPTDFPTSVDTVEEQLARGRARY